ncbi:MAG: hypothetical protein IIZ33_02125 [Erysipelotrichaceae bacterium]|nr:hypothetical protein [Erysipelotrichaceae bacterium]
MTEILRTIVETIAFFHRYISSFLLTHFGISDDKLMHLIVIGGLTFLLLFFLRPLISYLIRKHREMTLTFIYAFTIILVLSFSIEIGQKVTGTGNMEFVDIVYGIIGFLLAFLVYLVLYGIVHLMKKKAS